MVERGQIERFVTVRMPENVYEQKNSLPPSEYRELICQNIEFGLKFLLISHGIKIENSSIRTKTIARIEDKIIRRKSLSPLRDIYGIRFITEESDRIMMKNIIQSAYPLTPKKFVDGMPSFREYANLLTREEIKSKYNPRISDIYSAMHVNIVFLREGTNVLDIAEIQIMNKKEMEIYRNTREGYENGTH